MYLVSALLVHHTGRRPFHTITSGGSYSILTQNKACIQFIEASQLFLVSHEVPLNTT